ncbi:MAG: DUF3298 and DUF4163 domain-containing protein [Clostridium sp.]
MKQIISIILPLFITLGFIKSYPQNLSNNEIIHRHNTLEVVDKSILSEDDYLKINVKYPKFYIKNKKEINILNSNIEKWTLDWLDDIKLLSKSNYGDKYPAPSKQYEAQSSYDIKSRAEILSLTITYYQYTGGAHGLTTVIPYNYDILNDKQIRLADIFKSNYDYASVINNEIKKQILDNPDKYFQGSDGFNGIKENQNFYVEKDDIVIVFGLYEIAPYASGIIEFRIPIKVFDNNINYGKIN